MEIKTVILGEVTQRPRITNIICFLSFMGVSIEASDISVSFGIPIKVRQLIRNNVECDFMG